MGGLAVVVRLDGAPVEHAALRAMLAPALYRGPHGIATRIQGPIAMASMALHSTAESLHEQQPLLSRDGQLWLVADARVDNRDELIAGLREELAREGKHAEDADEVITDADLLLAATRRWQHEAPAHVLGDYAWVVWDARRRRLFAARDAFGVRPLHYTQQGALLCLASEAQQIIAHPDISTDIDRRSLLLTMAPGFVEPERSMFAAVAALPPAHTLLADGSGSSLRRYWALQPRQPAATGDLVELAERWRATLQASVDARLRSVGSVGCEVSSGLDASTVAALAHRTLQRRGRSLVGISYSYPSLLESDEGPLVRLFAEWSGIDIDVRNGEAAGDLTAPYLLSPGHESPLHLDHPAYVDEVQVLGRRQVRVLLTGVGGDDWTWGDLGSYARRLRRGEWQAVREACAHSGSSLPTQARRLYHCLVAPQVPDALRHRWSVWRGRDAARWPAWIATQAVQAAGLLQHDPTADRSIASGDRVEAAWQALEKRRLFSATLRRAEGMARPAHAAGIELRHPFYDRRVVQFVADESLDVWQRHGYFKWLTRLAMQGFLPDAMLWKRSKVTYGGRVRSALRHVSPQLSLHLRRALPLERLDCGNSALLATALSTWANGSSQASVGSLVSSAVGARWLSRHTS